MPKKTPPKKKSTKKTTRATSPREKTKTKKAPKRTPKKPASRNTEAPPQLPPVSSGALVEGTDPCTCGHAPEEHGRDAEHPGSTSCVVCVDDACVAYEADPETDPELSD